jgi:hypothetical protein
VTVSFTSPAPADGPHHSAAAAANAAVTDEALQVLRDALAGTTPIKRILLKAAAGAGKSHALKRLVVEALAQPTCGRVSVVAFTNKQTRPLAATLGDELGQNSVCLFVSQDAWPDVPADVQAKATVVTSTTSIPASCRVVISTVHKLGAFGELGRQRSTFGVSANGTPFDVLFYNPYRAWPTDHESDDLTWARELPAVWRPAAGHLALWRAFYPEWDQLNCVAAREDRGIEFGAPTRTRSVLGLLGRSARHTGLSPTTAAIWAQVSTGIPTLLEIDGLELPEAADVDVPLLHAVETLLDELLTAGFKLRTTKYKLAGDPDSVVYQRPGDRHDDPLIAILATRNQAVDDAADVVDRLREKHNLADNDLVSSTVDSYQGQTNGITVAIHPLTGAAQLDEFNSAFGRLAVTCTRATHGLLMVTRPGLDRLLGEAPARPGTPFGEPGNRHLPRQTHQRILATFARGTLTIAPTQRSVGIHQ